MVLTPEPEKEGNTSKQQQKGVEPWPRQEPRISLRPKQKSKQIRAQQSTQEASSTTEPDHNQ